MSPIPPPKAVTAVVAGGGAVVGGVVGASVDAVAAETTVEEAAMVAEEDVESAPLPRRASGMATASAMMSRAARATPAHRAVRFGLDGGGDGGCPGGMYSARGCVGAPPACPTGAAWSMGAPQLGQKRTLSGTGLPHEPQNI